MQSATVKTESLLEEIEQYWTRRAPSYSDLINKELHTDGLERWLPVLRENGIGDEPLHILDIGPVSEPPQRGTVPAHGHRPRAAVGSGGAAL